MAAIPVIKIKHKDGYCLINDSDFDESLHELYQDQEDTSSGVSPDARDVREDTSSGVSPDARDVREDTSSGVSPDARDVRSEIQKTINLNKAKKTELVSLTGVGTKTAEEILKARPFESVESAIAQFSVLDGLNVEV